MSSARAHRKSVLLASLLLAFAPLAASAADTVWTFEVREVVEVGPLANIIRLVPVPSGVHFPRTCEVFVIHSRFSHGQGVPGRYYTEFTEAAHRRALLDLRRAQTSKELVRIGSMDRGFGEPVDAPNECEVLSAGLAVILDADEQNVIFSVY